MYGKILSYHEDPDTQALLKRLIGTVVFTNGCFDLIHRGHVEYLKEAKAMGNILILGLNDDASVTRLKGPSRPILPFEDRSVLLAALASVDYVIPFKEDTPELLIQKVIPNILVKGGEYALNDIVGKDFVESIGGKVTTIPFLEGYSTTGFLKKLQNL